ncbi:MAG: hypothetical protein U0361_09885 [Nitrospiraceae bacterium]
MQAVVQEDRTGCGIASVAALTGQSYRRVRKKAARLGIAVSDERLWSETGHVRRLLASYGLHAARSERPFRDWTTLPSVALLAIKWHRRGNRAFWHWVVYSQGPDGPRVLDSASSIRRPVRTDFGRMRPKWYIEIRAGRGSCGSVTARR